MDAERDLLDLVLQSSAQLSSFEPTVTTANMNTARGQRCDEYRTIFKKTKVRKKERKGERGRLGLYTG